MRRASILLSAFGVLLSMFACMQKSNSHVPVSDPHLKDTVSAQAKKSAWPEVKTVNGIAYSTFFAGARKINLATTRPVPGDKNISFCIAAAFTRLDDNGIDGLFIENGEIKNSGVNRHLGGGLLIHGDSVFIIKTFEGKLPTKTWIDSVAALKCSFLQQIQLVRDDSALVFKKDKAFFQRRAVVIFKDSRTAVVESGTPITLQKFADDLVSLGVRNAIYTDMGGWDEGWYRDGSKVRTIGLMRGSTRRQSNWFVMTE
jgi:hypothetical protein